MEVLGRFSAMRGVPEKSRIAEGFRPPYPAATALQSSMNKMVTEGEQVLGSPQQVLSTGSRSQGLPGQRLELRDLTKLRHRPREDRKFPMSAAAARVNGRESGTYVRCCRSERRSLAPTSGNPQGLDPASIPANDLMMDYPQPGCRVRSPPYSEGPDTTHESSTNLQSTADRRTNDTGMAAPSAGRFIRTETFADLLVAKELPSQSPASPSRPSG